MNSATARENVSIDSFIGTTDSALHNHDSEATRRATGAWDIGVYTDHAVLEPVWRNMEEQGFCTIFQTYEWVSCWYETAISSGQAKPLIITVSEKGGSIVWILPLCLYEKKNTRIVSFADLHISDYIAPIMGKNAPKTRGSAQVIMKAVLKALPPCDIVHFQKISGKVGEMDNPLAKLKGTQPFQIGCHGIHLTEPWPALSKKIMQPRLRSTIQRQRKKIENEGAVTFEYHDRPETLRPALDRLMVMREKRFNAINRLDIPEGWKNFYDLLAAQDKCAFGLNIATMKVEGEEIAACFGLTRGKTYYALLPTFQIGKWEKYRPGLLLFDAMLTHFSKQGKEYFDFTVGDENYKGRFGCEKNPLHEWMIPRSFRGFIVYTGWRTKEILRKQPLLFNGIRKTARFLRRR